MPPVEIGKHHWKKRGYVIGPSDRQDHREPPAEVPDAELWELEPDELPDVVDAEVQRRIAIVRAAKQSVGRNLRLGELEALDKLL